MSFRKRNTVISTPKTTQTPVTKQLEKKPIPGVRPSPLDGRPATSTGTASLDSILAGHAGLPLGTCLLIEEDGTTDFSGVLLRYYAAEGLVQGHQVHALALHPGWKSELPGLYTGDRKSSKADDSAKEKMKIAWRYEALASPSGREIAREKQDQAAFCHAFDLKKRLSSDSVIGEIHFTESPSSMGLPFAASTSTRPSLSPLRVFIETLSQRLATSSPEAIHRVVIPSILSPMLYPPSVSQPSEALQFVHALRSLLRDYHKQLTAMITLPLSLYPRSSGMTRWIEHLCDGVMEMNPIRGPVTVKKPDTKTEDQMQGLFKVHTLPIFHERGGGGTEGHAARENLSFALSSSKGLVIRPYALPPMEEDEKKDKGGKADDKSLEF